MKKNRTFVFIILALCLGGILLLIKSRRPNVVLVIIDALRADKLGIYGFYPDISPEIDRMGSEGVLFEKVIAQCSWTRPSIGSMITGRYPRSIGLYKEQFDILPDRFPALAEILKENGYATVGITANPNINSTFNFHKGFDTYLDSNVIWRWMKEERDKKKFDALRHPLPDSKSIFRQMLNYGRSAARKPVYMQINLMEVHEGWNLVRPEFKKNIRGLAGVPYGYFDGIRQISYDLSQFINDLTKLPGWGNTLFIITSDHGQGLFDHPSLANAWDHGYFLYESQVMVPLILYYPHPIKAGLFQKIENISPLAHYYITRLFWWSKRLLPGFFNYLNPERIKSPVQLMDLLSTVLDYLKIPVPADIQGRSVLKLIYGEGKETVSPQYFVVETHYRTSNKIGIYSGKWKYIENRDNNPGVNRYELQPAGIKENGVLTDKLTAEKVVGEKMKTYLNAWETRYPGEKEVSASNAPPDEIIQQLKSLGYL